MDIIYLIFSMAAPVLGGTFFVRWLLCRDGELEGINAAFFGIGIGLAFTAFSMFILGLLRVPFTLAITALPVLVFMVLFFFLFHRAVKAPAMPGETMTSLRGWRLYLTVIMASWIALKVGFVFYESLTRPIFSVDSFLSWAISGKYFFYRAGLVLDPSNEHFFGHRYRPFLGHPLHLPLLQTWISLALGRFHEVYVKAPGPIYFAGVLGVLYYGVKREAGSLYALTTVFFMAGVPIFTAHGQDAYADLPLSFFALSGTVALWRFLRDDNLAYLTLSGIFLGTAIFVKNEGLFFVIAGGMALLIFLLGRKKVFIRPLAAFILPIIIIAGPWLLFKMHYGIGFGHSGSASGFKWLSDPLYSGSEGHGIHWEALTTGIKMLFFTANYNLIFPIWIVASLMAPRNIIRTEIKYLYMIILLVFSMFVFIYLTLEVTAVTDQSGIHRNTLTYLPIIYFATALVLSSIWPDHVRGRPEAGRGNRAFDR